MRSATQTEWESGQLVPQSSHIKGRSYEPKTEESVLLEGKLFRKSGPQWPILGEDTRISPDEKWLAVQSWEGQDYRNGDIFAPRGKPGKFSIDLYEVSFGRRLVAVEGEHRGSLRADVPLTVTFWLGIPLLPSSSSAPIWSECWCAKFQPSSPWAARIVPRHSPRPIRRNPGASHQPRRITSSPSSRNRRSSPVGKVRGSDPRRVISSRQPRLCFSGPETVPLPIKSPGRSGQPFEA